MTKITRPVVRSTGIFQRGEEIIVELQSTGLVARLKGLPSSRREIKYSELFDMLTRRDERRKP